MDKKPAVVYLEDLVAPAKASKAENASSNEQSATTATASKTNETKVETSTVEKKTSTGATKRQKSLMEMFSKSTSSTSSPPPAKRAKSGLSSNPSLNSIPFSLMEFQNGMTDEEKRLLALECETMGKSWSVGEL